MRAYPACGAIRLHPHRYRACSGSARAGTLKLCVMTGLAFHSASDARDYVQEGPKRGEAQRVILLTRRRELHRRILRTEEELPHEAVLANLVGSASVRRPFQQTEEWIVVNLTRVNRSVEAAIWQSPHPYLERRRD